MKKNVEKIAKKACCCCRSPYVKSISLELDLRALWADRWRSSMRQSMSLMISSSPCQKRWRMCRRPSLSDDSNGQSSSQVVKHSETLSFRDFWSFCITLYCKYLQDHATGMGQLTAAGLLVPMALVLLSCLTARCSEILFNEFFLATQKVQYYM